MTEFKKIIEELAGKDCGDFSFLNEKPYFRFARRAWEAIRRRDEGDLKILSSGLGEKKLQGLTEFFQNKYPEYFAMDFFRNRAIEIEVRRALLEKIYLNGVVVSDYPYLLEVIKGKIGREALDILVDSFKDMTFFCVSCNKAGKHLTEIFGELYDLDPEVSVGVEEIYNKNRLSLKLDYLIAMMEKHAGSEE